MSDWPTESSTARVKYCEVCESRLPEPILDLGMHPMCDDLVPTGDTRECAEYPIQIALCAECLTAHQVYRIKKEILFPTNYHYRPRFTQDVLNGMQELVAECSSRWGSRHNKLVCDIGCNDGSLLSFFREQGYQTCGIEPTNAALEASENGHHVIQGYFSRDTVADLLKTERRPDIVTFTNVFAHIESLAEAIEALQLLVHAGSVVVIENHYLGSILATTQFDTFYHEHPRTYSLRSFSYIAERLNAEVLFTSFPRRYGGNVRVHIGNFGPRKTYEVGDMRDSVVAEEAFTGKLEAMRDFVTNWRKQGAEWFASQVGKGASIAGKSFPGRAAILIRLLRLDHEMMPLIYEKPNSLKIGYYVPGCRIPIASDDSWISGEHQPACVLVWGWHIADEIATYMRRLGFKGDILKPLPSFEAVG